jgi:hypothetical protein
MKKRTGPTLLYARTSTRRWLQAAITTSDADLLNLCVWHWAQAASTAAAEESARKLRLSATGGAFPPDPSSG